MPVTVINTTELSESDQIFLWIKRNRGVCSRIARDFELTPTFIRSVLYGHSKSTDFRVEKALVASGAPFVCDRIEAA